MLYIKSIKFSDKNEERYEDDNWENYSDYDSNEEQTYQGDKIKKEQITSIIGNKSKHSSTDVSDRKKTYDSSKSQK